MAPRPDLTVVLRTRRLLLRADVRRGVEPSVATWRGLALQPGEAVAHALGEGSRPAKRVWVLDSEVWLGEVGLSGSATAGLSDKELVDPAAYEAEALSDLRPDEAVTGVVRRRMAEREDQFLVAQLGRPDVTAIAKAVRGSGAKLAGLGHPAGLPTHPATTGDGAAALLEGDWRRVEFWADSVVLTRWSGGRETLAPLGIGPDNDWRRVLDPQLRETDPEEGDHTVIETGVRVRGGPGWRAAGPL
ncbi:MAG: hypothetical protein AAFP86_07990, partial [Planctomycetota bacterium]